MRMPRTPHRLLPLQYRLIPHTPAPTQLATLLYATHAENPKLIVFLASAAALVLSCLVAVVAGSLISGHVAPRVFLLAESGAIHRWAPGTFLAWNVGTFCEKAGVSREAYDAKVRSCKSEELDTLGGGFSLKKKTSVRSETSRGRDGAVSEPRDGGDETETETGTDASASIRSAIRARAEGGGAAGRDRGSTPAERARARRAAKRRADAEKDE